MRFSLSTTILALIPITLCAPSTDVTNVEVPKALDIRAVKPNPAAASASPAPTCFIVESFEAWRPLPHVNMKSRAFFHISLKPPVAGWNVTCWTMTDKALCDPNVWYNCTNTAENESVMFRCGHDLTSMDIKRRWTYRGTTMTVTASESAEWNESVNPRYQNVSVSQWGRCYKKPDVWQFNWKTMVG